MTKCKLTLAQKDRLEWIVVWSVIGVLLLTFGEYAYLSYLHAAWWSRTIFVLLLVVELGLYFLWGMISMGRIAPRTILVFVCQPLRDLAYFLLRLTHAYAREEEVTFTVIEIRATPPASREADSDQVLEDRDKIGGSHS